MPRGTSGGFGAGLDFGGLGELGASRDRGQREDVKKKKSAVAKKENGTGQTDLAKKTKPKKPLTDEQKAKQKTAVAKRSGRKANILAGVTEEDIQSILFGNGGVGVRRDRTKS